MRKLYQLKYCYFFIFPFILLFAISTARAQKATFFENFDETEIAGLPEGWTYYQKGGNNPSSRWMVTKTDQFSSKFAWSNWGEAALDGQVDEDWLITPQITPTEGDFLAFDAFQVYVFFDYGGKYHVLISTKSNNPKDFEDTLASYTESEFPGYQETLLHDLAKYKNKPVYIAFVHENPSSIKEEADDWYLDNVWVRPKQPAGFYKGHIINQSEDVLPLANSATGVIIGIEINIIGDYDLANITSLTFSNKGTIDPSQIISASLYSTGQDPFIGTNDDENTIDAELFGTTDNPGQVFEIKGNMDLPVGNNYFWMFFKLKPDYTPKFPYQSVAASFDKVVINGKEEIIAESDMAGFRPVVETRPINDSIKYAIELSPVGGRYGSYNTRATPEPAYEKLAYCAPDGYFDVTNSIWWHFKAPTDGFITADLTETDFNTVLLILDKNFDQFACNDNISDDQQQSKITDYEVKAGQELYIRVTGSGSPSDPNGPSGIVILNFSFISGPLGIEDPARNGITLSNPYPNPTNDKSSLDFELKEPGKISFDIRDVMGKSVWSTKEHFYVSGVKHSKSIDISDLSAGTYIVHVRGNKIDASRKLIITR